MSAIKTNWKNIFRTLLIVIMVGFMLPACSETPEESAGDQGLEETANYGNVVSASGKVLPVHWADLSFETGGRLTVLVEEGEQVAAGDVLARLETDDLQHAVEQAGAVLAAAEAELALAEASARAEDVTAAEGSVMVASGNLAAAEGSLQKTENGTTFAVQQAEANLARAQAALAAAKAQLGVVNADLARLLAGPRAEEVAQYQALLNQAQSEFLLYENLHFDQFISNDIGGGPEERARYQRESARGARDAAQARLDLLNAGASAETIAAAQAAVSAAQAQVGIAEADVAAAEISLAEAQALDADIHIAEAQVQIAEGQLMQAEAQRDRLTAGASAEEIAVLQAQVAQAEAALAQAEAALNKATLTAPFPGTIGVVYAKIGQSLTPGVPVLALGDVTELHVETTDLNEVDAARVHLDSPVTLTFDALPGDSIEGEIVRIAPMASSGQGGTNFTAVINMIDPPEGLLWGMTAFVDVEVD